VAAGFMASSYSTGVESDLTTAAVVGPLDPGRDRDPQFLAGLPSLPVEDVLLQQREERLHRGVVAGRTNPAHGADHVMAVELVDQLPGTKLRPAVVCSTQPATPAPAALRRATALSSALTAILDVIHESIE